MGAAHPEVSIRHASIISPPREACRGVLNKRQPNLMVVSCPLSLRLLQVGLLGVATEGAHGGCTDTEGNCQSARKRT
ncbi:hypothetical protein L218DRAFT_603589 [Marasmius fiardii PR-910]|nr:hypothetical protein L218DRAFT_603589 [Marasmius fiardii PR-910]